MAFCEDPALTYLNRLGYNVIRLPRTGLMPLEVLGSESGRAPEPLGRLDSVWESKLPVPAVTSGDVATVSGRSTIGEHFWCMRQRRSTGRASSSLGIPTS